MLTLREWSETLDVYVAKSTAACAGHPSVTLQHSDLMDSPYATTVKLHAELASIGVRGIAEPSRERIRTMIGIGRNEGHGGPLVVSLDKPVSLMTPLRAGDCVVDSYGRAHCLPSFLIIGTQRAGMGALQDWLSLHPALLGDVNGTNFLYWLSYARVTPLLARAYALRMPSVARERAGDALVYDTSSAYLDKV